MSDAPWILRAAPKVITGYKKEIEIFPQAKWDEVSPNLMPYQRNGLAAMTQRKNSLLADEMGLGKSVQAISFCQAYPQYRRILIVCPASLVINWDREIQKWGNAGSYKTWHTVSYYGVPDDDTEWDVVIVDEAHMIKNVMAQRSRAVMRVCKRAKRVLLLTGTPMPNGSPLELWPLLQITAPNAWDPAGPGKKDANGNRPIVAAGEGAGFFPFAKRYCAAKKKRFGAKVVWDFNGASHLDELNERLASTCMIRRLKKDVLQELPDKVRQIIYLEGRGENEFTEFRNWTEKNLEAEIRALECKEPKIFAELSAKRHDQALKKVDEICDILYDSAEKTVIFAHHLDVIRQFSIRLGMRGCVKLTGNESREEKQMAVDVFQDDPNCRFFVGSLHAAGVGLTLTASSHVVFAELDWTPKTLLQAEDRVHRFGQKNGVLVQYFVTQGSLDAHVAKLLLDKFTRLEKAGLAGST